MERIFAQNMHHLLRSHERLGRRGDRIESALRIYDYIVENISMIRQRTQFMQFIQSIRTKLIEFAIIEDVWFSDHFKVLFDEDLKSICKFMRAFGTLV